MSQEQKTEQKTALDSIRIKDQKLIDKIKKEIPEPFIPKFEDGTFDEDILEQGRYTESAKEIGGQYIPVAVAYCPNDPVMKKKLDDGNQNPDYNPESPFRVHGRVVDGRHRYKDALSRGLKWEIEYINVKDYPHYMMLRGHMDQKKSPNKKEHENFFDQYCKYVFEKEGVPIQDVCKYVVDKFKNVLSEAAIRSYIPPQYKDSKMASLREGQKKEIDQTVAGKKIAEKLKNKNKKELSRKDKEIEKLHQEQTENFNQISELESQIKIRDVQVNEYHELKPFLEATHKAKVEGADIQVEVSLDIVKKDVKVKKV